MKSQIAELDDDHIIKLTKINGLLDLKDILYILSRFSCDVQTAENLLTSCLNKTNYQNNTRLTSLELALHKQLESDKLETAKTITRCLAHRFKILPSIGILDILSSVTFLQFIQQEFGDQKCYCDEFGTSMLDEREFLYERKRLDMAKNRLMEIIHEDVDPTCSSNEVLNILSVKAAT